MFCARRPYRLETTFCFGGFKGLYPLTVQPIDYCPVYKTDAAQYQAGEAMSLTEILADEAAGRVLVIA